MEKLNLIAGEWASGTDWAENINPSDTTDVIGQYARASAEQTRHAIAAAKAAAPTWAQSTPQSRADALEAVGVELLARREELGELLSREEGKILSEGIGEVTRAAHVFKFYAQEALRIEGVSMASVRPGVRVEVRHEPVGVVGLITPWNYPIAIPAWKIAPALAYGNTVVFKPADLTPGCGWALAEILSRAGLPAGVFNFTDLIVQDAQVIAHPPVAIKGLIEARGVGLLTLKHRSAIPIFLIVDLDQDEPDRLPEITYQNVMGIQIRCLKRCDGPHFAATVYLMAKMMKYTADD